MPQDYIKHILNARVYDVAKESPLDNMRYLSNRLNNKIWLKREDLQSVFSFKLRGAYNKIFYLKQQGLLENKGIIASSAGNHAQGVALAANRLQIRAYIVMPTTTPSIKVEAVRVRGGIPLLYGDAYDEAYQYAKQYAEKEGLVFIHPYDDFHVIAGQGTIAREILQQHPDPLQAIFVPVGGGGLIAGISVYVKFLRPEIKVIGVEPEDTPTLYTALKQQQRAILEQVGLFADGVAVKQIGEKPFELASKYVDEVILVSNDELCAAIKDIFEDTRAIAEPAGALALAGVKKYIYQQKVENQSLVAINSGANMNFDRLRYVAERAELGEKRETIWAVTIPERPGSFKQFCELLNKRSITEFNYRYSDAAQAEIFVGIKIAQIEEKQEIKDIFDKNQYPAIDMSENEMAKLHVRYMVGGHSQSLDNEILYRFEFPERPSALLQFLQTMQSNWNISLFHYRNHGSDYGRVLVGFQVPEAEKEIFQNFLNQLGYPYIEETNNPAYELFLK